MFIGCVGHQYNVKEIRYVPQSRVAENEIRVFVFRISNFTGSGNKFAIINNDTVVGSLGSGEFTSFIAKGDQNLVAAVIPTDKEDGARGFHYFEGRKGEEVYIRFKLAMQEDLGMKEISREEAYELMADYDYQELQEFPKPKWRVDLLSYYRRFLKQKAD
ncbi:MAG: hypothetical protein DRH26_12960 [Deltaproteobacteria bacterium]|nr:MAG: hypothetical protein DRH26_12960 [Deltaproteobacteria bacterium]